MKRLCICIFSLCLLPACSGPPALVIKNARILTPEGTWSPNDLRIRGPYIESIAPAIETDAHARVLDLRGAYVTPGLVDAHGHLLALGQSLVEVDLRGTTSYEAAVERVTRKAREILPGRWIIGRGWDQNLWPGAQFPDEEELSTAVPSHPVLLHRVDGHALLANRRAMELAGIRPSTPDPEGGEILRNAKGLPTGVFIDNAEALVADRVPQPSPEERRIYLLKAMDHLAALGLTAFGDAGTDAATLEALFALEREGRMKVRVNVMLDDTPELLKEWFARGPYADPWIRVQTVKAYMDGALGSRGAYLSQDYTDRPGHRGFLVTKPTDLEALARDCSRHNFMLAVHAIGDEAVHLALKAFAGGEGRGKGFRLEHIQLMRPEGLLLMKSMGVTASVMPYHWVSDSPWLASRIGDRPLLRYPWRSLAERRILLLFGSDCPVESPDPAQAFRAAVERDSESLSPLEALRACTLAHALSLKEEAVRGALREGAYADLTVFASDILQDPASSRVQGTFVNGKITFREGM
jgi:hypothetical protein